MTHPGASPVSRAAWSSTRRRWLATFCLVWVVVGVPAAVWAVITPPFGAPDEGAHVINAAAVVRGQALTDEFVSVPGSSFRHAPVVDVPGYLAEAETASECFEREPSVPMTCAPPFDGEPAEREAVITHVGNYPPLFYLSVGWATWFLDGFDAVVAMRGISAVLCSAVAAAGAATLRTVYPSRAVIAATLLALTPMAIFLFGSVNPSGLEIALALALWAGMLTFASTSTTALDARLLFVGVAAAALANARPAAMLWSALIILVSLVLVPAVTWRAIWGRRSLIASVGVAAVGTLASLGWYALADPGRSLGGPGARDLSHLGTIGGVQEAHLGNLSGYVRSLIGNVGWLDAPLPAWAVLVYGVAALGLVWAALTLGRWRGVAALVLAALLLIETPVLVQYPSATEVGLIWQGRYSLPLWVGIPLLGLVVLTMGDAHGTDRGRGRLADRITLPALVVVLLVHATMFWVAVPRFYVGLGRPMDFAQAPGHVPWALLALGVPTLLLLLVLLAPLVEGGKDEAPHET